MGRIVDEKEAYNSCSCYRKNPRKGDDPENLICYSPGVIGTLSREQCKQCKDIEFLATSKELRRHFQKFGELGLVSATCLSGEEGKTTIEFYDCLSKEAKKQIKSVNSKKEQTET